MSNRQARREQMRGANSQRGSQRPAGRPAGGRPSGPPPRRGGSTVFTPGYLIGLAVIVLVLVGILVFAIVSKDSGDEKAVGNLKDASASIAGLPQSGFKLGKDDAPVKIAAFEDFQCPFCLRYTTDQEPKIIEELVKTGRVQLIFQNLPLLGQESVNAARAGVCAANENKFWELHNRLFTIQAEAGQATSEKTNVGRFSEDKLKQVARDVGLDGAKFDSCYGDPATLAAITEQGKKATSFGFRSTPSFSVNDKALGAGSLSSIDDWKKLVDQEEKALSGTPAATGSATASPAASASASAAATSPSAAAPSAAATPAR